MSSSGGKRDAMDAAELALLGKGEKEDSFITATGKNGSSNGTTGSGGQKAGVSTQVKAVLLMAVVLQNATLNVAARRSRVTAELEDARTGCGYKSTTAVVVIEVSKVVLSFGLLTAERLGEYGFDPLSAAATLYTTTTQNPLECAKILVPACLYTVQNNLLLVAADNLEGPVLALFGQLKILATALFSVVLLRRALGARRWVSLFVLTGAIAMVNVSQMRPASQEDAGGDEGSKNLPLGLAVTALISTISGFSGVYFEMVLKNSPISVWVRNIHLASFSSIVALIAVYSADAQHVRECGFFGGYGAAVWLYVAVQAGGGLLIAAVIKYADNILKAFATSVAIVVVALVSAAFYDFQLSELFFAGASGVVWAVFLYGDLLKDLPLCRRLPPWLGGTSLASVVRSSLSPPSSPSPPKRRRSGPGGSVLLGRSDDRAWSETQTTLKTRLAPAGQPGDGEATVRSSTSARSRAGNPADDKSNS